MKRLTNKERLGCHIDINLDTGCWDWTGGTSPNGYGRIRVEVDGEWRMQGAHRFSYELFIGPIPEGMSVLHNCNNPGCVNHEHLYLGTQQDNIKQMYSEGRGVDNKGELCGNAKLTEDQVLEIRDSNESQTTLAAMYGVSRANISAIQTGRSWSHI